MSNINTPHDQDIFKTMVADSPIPTALYVGRELVVQFANRAILSIWGKDESVIGKRLADVLPELKDQPFLKLLEDAFVSGEVYHGQEHPASLLTNGHIKSYYFNITYKPLRNADGEIFAVLSMAADITAQAKARLQLKEIQEKITFALDSAEMGTWTLYPIERIIQCDDRCKELCGFQKTDTITFDNLTRYLHPADFTRVIAAAEYALNPQSGGNYDVELRVLVGADIKLRWLRCKGKAYFNQDGVAYRFAGTAVDITESVELKEAREQSELKAGMALNAAGLGFWSVYALENRVELDARCQDMYGWPHPEIALDHLVSMINPEDRAQIFDALKQSAGGPKNENPKIEYRLTRPSDRSERWIRLNGKPYFNEHGKPHYFTGTAEDITTQKRNEAALRNVEKRFEQAFDNASVGVVIMNTDGRVVLANKAFSSMIGYSQAELYDINFSAFGHPDDFNANMDLIKQAISGEIPSYTLEKRYIKKDGGIVWGRISAALLRNEDGSPDSFISIIEDTTQERRNREEQRKLLFLVDNSSDFVSLSDMEGNVTYVNSAGQAMVGFDKPGDFARHSSEYLMPGELTRLKAQISKQPATGSWKGEIQYRDFKTGHAIPVFATTMLVYDGLSSAPVGRATVVRDLRAEIAAQQALTDSEHLLKIITSAAPNALWMTDEAGQMTYVNQTWVDWTGYAFGAHMADGWTKAILNKDREKARSKLLEDLKERRYHESHFRIKHQDGSIRWCIATGNPQFDAGGNFTGYIGACTDVTEKVLAEQKLKQLNADLNNQVKQFEFVTDFMPVQLWTAKVSGELDYVNRRAIEYFGTGPENITGEAWLNLIHPDDRAGCMEVWLKSVQTGNPYQYEFRIKDANDVHRWHLARALPFRSQKGIIKWFGTNTDIDEQKQLQRQKDEFIGIASHELKTPVTSIKAYAQVLEAIFRKKGDLKEATMVAKVNVQIDRLTNLISDLLDVTKLHTGKMQFNEAKFDFNQMVNEVVEDMQRIAERHHIIEEYAETGIVYADKDRISQVITNLITNAIKYSPDAEKVIVKTIIKDTEVHLSVRDFGIGIPSDKKEKVFEQFYRVSGDKQHTFPGLGLGLYISSEIIRREGGRIWVESAEGQGSTFCFSIPINKKKIKLFQTICQ